MGRISRPVMFMGIARLASQRSTCFRLNVGAVVTRDNDPISIGWNGARSGEAHCSGNECPGVIPGKCPTLHAEANALRKASHILVAGSSVDLYVTDSPCPECSLMILNSDLYVKRIFFERPYRSREHLGMFHGPYPDPLREGKETTRVTEVYEVTPAGYIVEYFSRSVVELP